MKSFFLLLILSFSFCQIFGQTKTFNGTYPLSGDFYWVDGKAIYTYSEAADYSRLKNGSFSFSANMSGKQLPNHPNGGFSQTVVGRYKDNLKDGAWNHTMIIKNIPNISGTISGEINYKNGVPEGLWQMTFKDAKSGVNSENYTLNFKNGLVVGKFNTYNKFTNESITGFCNDEGFLDGKLIARDKTIEIIKEYDNGLFKSKTIRKIATGEVLDRIESSAEDMEIAKKILLLAKTNPKELDNMPFKLVVEHSPQTQSIFSDAFKIGIFPNDFLGDISYNKASYKFEWKAFKYMVLVEQETTAQKAEKVQKAEAEKIAREQEAEDDRIAQEQERKRQAIHNELSKLQQTDAIQDKKIIDKYSLTINIPIPIIGTVSKPKIRKPKIYDAYTTLSAIYRKEIGSASDLSENLAATKKLILLQEKIIYLSDQNTKDIEKQLKNVTDIEQMAAILGLK